MKRLGILLVFLGALLSVFQPARAQSDSPHVVVLTIDGTIYPPLIDYLERGMDHAAQNEATLIVIQMNTPGGDLGTTIEIVEIIRASVIPVVVYVAPNGALAGSAGAIITMSAHASAMAPETVIGASTPISGTGENLDSDARAKGINAAQALIRPFVEPRGEEALELANAMIAEAKAVTAQEALDAGLIDFIADDLEDLLNLLNGFTVDVFAGPLELNLDDPEIDPVDMSAIERLLFILTDPNIAFLLIAIGIQAVLIEISSPGGWVAGFIGVVCLTLASYGLGVLPVNWFGAIFLITAFVLFILDIQAPTHGALTTAGVASFIVGALVLFNSPGTPEFQQVSVPLVIFVGLGIGALFFLLLIYALRALRAPVAVGAESLVGKVGTARSWEEAAGQVQLDSELWSAESSNASDQISKGDTVEVVEVSGIRLKVKKK
jgi:membrane-bound serine protease (ClpP class)